jgi:hypothetical protein
MIRIGKQIAGECLTVDEARTFVETALAKSCFRRDKTRGDEGGTALLARAEG